MAPKQAAGGGRNKPAQDYVVRLWAQGLSEQAVRQQLWQDGYKAGRISQLIKHTRPDPAPVAAAGSEREGAEAAAVDPRTTLWEPDSFQIVPGVLLPHMHLPPKHWEDLSVLGASTWQGPLLTVPPDGLCIIYCFLAAAAPEKWQRLPRSELGFIEDVFVEQTMKDAANCVLKAVIQKCREAGEERIATRLEDGRYPGDAELGFYANVFGAAFLVVPTDEHAFPVIHGQGPVGLAVRHVQSFDAAGAGAGHFELVKSWLPPQWLDGLDLPLEVNIAFSFAVAESPGPRDGPQVDEAVLAMDDLAPNTGAGWLTPQGQGPATGWQEQQRAMPAKRRLRGKQAAPTYNQLPYAPRTPPPSGAAPKSSPRGRWLGENCTGISPGKPCIFAADGSGAAAYGNFEGRCCFCNPGAMRNALATEQGRKNVARSLRAWKRHAAPIFDAALSQSTLASAAPAVREQLREAASDAQYETVLARRISVLAAPTPEEKEGYEKGMAQDRTYVQKKFFPATKRIVRHAGYRWSNPMTEAQRAEVQDLLPNDTGLPAAGLTPNSRALEQWCREMSWALCRQCASVQPSHLKEKDLKKAGGEEVLRCKNCLKPADKRMRAPQPEDVPEPLRGLTRAELQALRPLDIDCGPIWKAEFGYYFHSSMIRFSWAAMDVEDKIKALDRKSRKRAKKAGEQHMLHDKLSKQSCPTG